MLGLIQICALSVIAVTIADHTPQEDYKILQSDVGVIPDEYQHTFKTSNGIAAQESGALKNDGREDESISVQGIDSSSYTGHDGQPISISYTPEDHGNQPVGEHH